MMVRDGFESAERWAEIDHQPLDLPSSHLIPSTHRTTALDIRCQHTLVLDTCHARVHAAAR